MPDAFDFAIIGSTPLAGLLAGLLASSHGRRVCLVGEPWSPYRLARRFDLSVMPATRPETWMLLKEAGAETLKLLNSIARGLYERVDPLFVADRTDTVEYLGHMRWTAFGLGFAAERAAEPAVPCQAAILRIRDGAKLSSGRIEPALEDWLKALGVERLAPETNLVWRRKGGAWLGPEADGLAAGTVVLADDAAIAMRLRPRERHRLLTIVPATGVLGEVTRPLPTAFMTWLDRDTALYQRAGQGPVAAVAWGDRDSAHARIGSTLGGDRRMKRGGEARFVTVDVSDGAPLLGRMGPGRAVVLAGLGMSAAFLAPALARWLAGDPHEAEAQYFAARETARAGQRRSVADRPCVDVGTEA